MIKRKWLAVAVCMTLGAASVALADIWAKPGPRLFAGDFGQHGFRMLNPQEGGKSTGELYAIGNDGKEFVIWRSELVNVPQDVFIAPGGKRVITIDTHGHLGGQHALVVYGERGQVIADYEPGDFLNHDDIFRHITRSASSLHWARAVVFSFSHDKQQFLITPKWLVGLPIHIKGVRENLGAISDPILRSEMREMLDKIEKHLGPPQARDGTIILNLKTGQFIKSGQTKPEPSNPPKPQ